MKVKGKKIKRGQKKIRKITLKNGGKGLKNASFCVRPAVPAATLFSGEKIMNI